MERDKQQSIEAKGGTATDSYAPGVCGVRRAAHRHEFVLTRDQCRREFADIRY